MDYMSNVYEVDGRWEYDILQNGSTIIHQDFDPDAPGLTPMDEARATEAANIVLKRLS